MQAPRHRACGAIENHMSAKPDPIDEPPAPTRRSKVLARVLIIGLGLLVLAHAGALLLAR
jgi:hypothetical protein